MKMNADHHKTPGTATRPTMEFVTDRDAFVRSIRGPRRRVEFHGRPVTAVHFRERWAWRAAEVGQAIGYAEGARLVDKIRGEWADEFRDGKDYEVLRGRDLHEFRRVLDSPESGESFRGRGGARSLLVLYESGIDRALILARTPLGRELRDLLVDHVLPQLRTTGTATLPGAPSNDTVLIDLQRQVITLREILATQREIAQAAEQAVTARVVRLEAEIASGLLGPLKGAEIDRRLTSLSKRATAYSGRKWRSYRRSKANFLAHALGHVGASSSWRFLPAGKEEHAFRTLAAMEREADAAMEKAASAAQDNLPAVPVTGKPAAEAPNPVALLHPRTGKRIEC